MNSIARPADASESLFHRVPSTPVPIGTPLAVGSEECAVVTLNGQVLGVAPPGTYSMDPRVVPVLAPAVVGSMVQAEVWFVRTSPLRGIQVGGSLGSLIDPLTRVRCTPRGFGEYSLVVANAARFVAACEGNAFSSADLVVGWVTGQIQRKIVERFAHYMMVEKISISKQAELSERLSHELPAEMTELDALGIHMQALGSFTINLLDEDRAQLSAKMRELAELELAERAAGVGAPHCARCGAPSSAGRFCVECGAPLSAA